MTSAAPARLWDLPTRVFHWLIVVLVAFSWWSATYHHLPWHRLSGYAILGLLIFRLIWGLAGGETARFARFLRGPAAVFAYLRGRAGHVVGHSPIGGWSVAAMLAVLSLQVGLGLFSVDEDGLEAGPLDKFVDFDTGRAIARLHHLNFWLLLALIVLHLGAVAFYALRRRNLIGPMITGRAHLPPGAAPPALAARWRFFAAAIAAALIAAFLARGLKF